jgi:hypothetical protein
LQTALFLSPVPLSFLFCSSFFHDSLPILYLNHNTSFSSCLTSLRCSRVA